MILKVKKEFKRVDCLVNSAGITKDKLLITMKKEDFQDVMETNMYGTFYMCRGVLPLMSKQKNGVIINISSVIGIIGNAGQSNYAASKAAIIGFSKSIAKEYASRNIRTNVIAPGFIQTAMTDVLSLDVKNNVLENIPLKRFGQARDVANLVQFLVSDKANYITGQVVKCDGGMVI